MPYSLPPRRQDRSSNWSTASSSLLSHSRRKLAARETLERGNLVRARGSAAPGRARVSLFGSTVAEVVGPCVAQVVFTLSRGERRRSLAFNFSVFSGSHRKGAGTKKTKRVEGETARGCGARASSKDEMWRSRRLVLGGGSCWHPRTRHEARKASRREEAPCDGRRPGSVEIGFPSRGPVHTSLAP